MTAPAKKIKLKGVDIAIWQSGSITMQIRKQDFKTKEWGEAKYLDPSDIAHLIACLNLALPLAVELTDKRYEENKAKKAKEAVVEVAAPFKDDDIPF